MYKSKVRSLLKKYCQNTVSYQCLMEGVSYFESELWIEGFIPYIKVKKVYFVGGDPICSPENMEKLVHEFRTFCRKSRSYCVFISTSLWCKELLEKMNFGTLKVWEEALFDVDTFSLEGHDMKANRNFVRRATKEGVVIKKLEKHEEQIFSQIENIETQWLKNRKTKEFSFLLKLDVLDDFENKLIFVAVHQEKIVACLSCVPIYGKNGWYLEDMIYLKNSLPVWTTQLLVFETLEYLKKNGFQMASFWTSPLIWLEKEKRSKFWKTQAFQTFCYRHLNTFYNFKWLYSFKKSLYPTSWENKYYCFFPPRFTLKLFLLTIKLYYPKGVSGVIFSRAQKLFFKKRLWKR